MLSDLPGVTPLAAARVGIHTHCSPWGQRGCGFLLHTVPLDIPVQRLRQQGGVWDLSWEPASSPLYKLHKRRMCCEC